MKKELWCFVVRVVVWCGEERREEGAGLWEGGLNGCLVTKGCYGFVALGGWAGLPIQTVSVLEGMRRDR